MIGAALGQVLALASCAGAVHGMGRGWQRLTGDCARRSGRGSGRAGPIDGPGQMLQNCNTDVRLMRRGPLEDEGITFHTADEVRREKAPVV
jgi:hypothetical protein